MIRSVLLVCLVALTTQGPAFAQGTITAADVNFVRGATPWDGSPDANWNGVAATLTADQLFETGWAFRVAGATQETFFPAPTTQNYASPQSVHTWNDVGGAGLFSAVETSVVVDLDGAAGPTPSGTVTMTMTISNLSAVAPLTLDLFHMVDFDLQPTAGNDSALLLAAAPGPVIRVNDALTTFAIYTADGADAYLVRPFGATDLGQVLSNADATEFDNTGLPFGPSDFTGGTQWNNRVIPPSGSAAFTVRMAVNNKLLAADLAIDISDAPDPVAQGTAVDYTITVTNAGPDVAPAVTVGTLLPAGLTFVETTGCTQDPGGSPDCTLGTIAAGGSAQFTLRAQADIGTLGNVMLSASATSLQINETATGNNTADETTTVVEATADLLVTLADAPDPVLAGTALTYTVSVSNTGPGDATGVVATATLPGTLGAIVTTGCAEDPAGVPTCTLGAIASGATVQYTIATLVAAGATGTVDAEVSVAGNEQDDDPANDTATASTAVIALQPDLTIAKSNNVGGVAVVDAGWSWTLQARNAASATVAAEFTVGDRIVFDQLPDTAITYGAPAVTTAGGVTGTLSCGITAFDLSCTATGAVSIPPGGTISISVVALPEDLITYFNPRIAGGCSVDPDDNAAETLENNNGCNDAVEVIDFLLFADGFED